MSKKVTLFWVSVFSLGFTLLALLTFVGMAILISSTTNFYVKQIEGFIYIYGFYFLLSAVGTGLFPWIAALIRAYRMGAVGWFLVVFFLGSLGSLLYAIGLPAEPPACTGGTYTYPPPGQAGGTHPPSAHFRR